MKRWISTYHHLMSAVVWACTTLPVLLWWKNSVLYVALNAIYVTVKTDIAAYHAKRGQQLQEEREALPG